jgi:hypothetical protein
MARQDNSLTGELFVSLEPTVKESRRSGGGYRYQQIVVNDLIEEFGLETEAMVQTLPLARFQLITGNVPFPRTGTIVQPVQPGETRPLDQCIHLGYISVFLIIRQVPQHSTFACKNRHQWQQELSLVENFLMQITNPVTYADNKL